MRNKISFLLYMTMLIGATGCKDILDFIGEPRAENPRVSVYATGLTAPLGLEADPKGRLWVTEAGTGLTNDGQLSVITQQGTVYPVVTGFPSSISPEGGVFGLNHLILVGQTLWMAHGVEGKLYRFDISTFQPGDAPLRAADLAYDDIGTFVKSYDFAEDTGESDILNLTVGPAGDLFIVDAGANAIIRRRATTGELSVFATVPPIDNPSGSPAQVESVPTGIVFDGSKFLVSTFTGYPFPAQRATIYHFDLAGNASVYQDGFSSLADIELGFDRKPVVVEYGTWTGETFASSSGAIVRSTPQGNTRLVTGINFPNAIVRSGLKTYYIAQTFDGIIQKVVL